MSKTTRIRRIIEIEVIVPSDETLQDTEQWIEDNFIPGCSLERTDTDHIIRNIRLAKDDDDQDAFVVVSWPQSQELCLYEGYEQNCSFIMGDTLDDCSYLVNKEWYARMKAGKLAKVEEYQLCEDVL